MNGDIKKELETIHNLNEISTEFKKASEADKEARQERFLLSLKAITAVLLVLFFVSFLLEAWGMYQVARAISQREKSEQAAQRRAPRIKTSNLKRYFPVRITGYHTKGRRDIIGQEKSKAEAVYEPEDMNLQLKSPIVTYCQVVYFNNLSEAEKFLQEKLKEFPKDQKAIVFENTYASTGYTMKEDAYFLGTIYKGLVFWFKTSYVELVPHEAGRLETLKFHNEKIASEVIKFIPQAESGVEQIESN